MCGVLATPGVPTHMLSTHEVLPKEVRKWRGCEKVERARERDRERKDRERKRAAAAETSVGITIGQLSVSNEE